MPAPLAPPLAPALVIAGVFASLLLAVTLVLAAAVAGLMAYHYAQARLRERRGFTFDPQTNAVTEEPEGPAAVRAKSAEEIRQIRQRIETLMEQQQMHSETQSQHLAQKLDDIRMHMGNQDRKLDGLKSELRHEIRRRDSELDELRGQLAGALDAFWKAMPALPPAGPSGDALALPAPAEAAPPAAAPTPEEAAGVWPIEGEAPATAAAPSLPSFAPLDPSSPTVAPAAPEATPAPAWADAGVWADAMPLEPPDPSFPQPFEPPAAEPLGTPAAPGRPAFGSMDAYLTAPSPEPAAPAAPAAAPEGADDLTVIRGVDEETQRKLYAAGITTLEEMARWSRADARRISGAVGVPEETIMHQWIFEAQSFLFESYQRQIAHQHAARAVPA